MLGRFQHSQIRIEVKASQQQIGDALTQPQNWPKWLWGRTGFPQSLTVDQEFTTWLGPIPVHHVVGVLESNHLRFLLSQGIDGVHDWSWGEGWVQSQLEGITTLPLNLGQTLTLMQLRNYVECDRT